MGLDICESGCRHFRKKFNKNEQNFVSDEMMNMNIYFTRNKIYLRDIIIDNSFFLVVQLKIFFLFVFSKMKITIVFSVPHTRHYGRYSVDDMCFEFLKKIEFNNI